MDVIAAIYDNLWLMLEKYRGYTMGPRTKKEEAMGMIQRNEYVKIQATDTSGHPVHVFVISRGSKYGLVDQFKLLIRKVKDPRCSILFVTHTPFSSYLRKEVNSMSESIRIFNYLHMHFCIEIPKGPHCAPHSILSPEEARHLILHELHCHPQALPRIRVDDSQAIWIGAEVGQIVRIVSESPIGGYTCKYRVVVPAVARIKAVRQADDATEAETDDEDLAED
jgi:DNA-directed RNA polymerase subunit H (RpoH/RPB5)